MGFFDDLIEPEREKKGAPPAVEASTDTVTSDDATVSIEDISIENIPESASTGDDDAPLAGGHEQVTVPPELIERPDNQNLRARFTGHEPVNDLVRQDWIKSIKLNPDAFDALLYRAVSLADIEIDDDGYEKSDAERLDPNQEVLRYDDPEPVVVVDAPDEMAEFYSMNDSDENTGAQDDVLILSIAAFNIPIGSILDWDEKLSDTQTIRRWWYVHRKFNYGTASVGTLYYCIPCRSFEGLFNVQ